MHERETEREREKGLRFCCFFLGKFRRQFLRLRKWWKGFWMLLMQRRKITRPYVFLCIGSLTQVSCCVRKKIRLSKLIFCVWSRFLDARQKMLLLLISFRVLLLPLLQFLIFFAASFQHREEKEIISMFFLTRVTRQRLKTAEEIWPAEMTDHYSSLNSKEEEKGHWHPNAVQLGYSLLFYVAGVKMLVAVLAVFAFEII